MLGALRDNFALWVPCIWDTELHWDTESDTSEFQRRAAFAEVIWFMECIILPETQRAGVQQWSISLVWCASNSKDFVARKRNIRKNNTYLVCKD